MADFTTKFNSVRRLVDPEIRAQDERARMDAEIKDCEDFLKEKAVLEAEVAKSTPQELSEDRINAAMSELPEQQDFYEELKMLQKAFTEVSAVERIARSLETDVTRLINQIEGKKAVIIFGSRSDNEVKQAPESPKVKGWKKSELYWNGLALRVELFPREDLLQIVDSIKALRGVLAEAGLPEEAQSPLARKLFYRDVVVGHKTTREAGYPLVFLTQKVTRPVIKRQPVPRDESEKLVSTVSCALDVIEAKAPAVMQVMEQLAACGKVIADAGSAENKVTGAAKQLENIPAGFEQDVRDHLALLKRGRAALSASSSPKIRR